jgi:hypothetical protein
MTDPLSLVIASSAAVVALAVGLRTRLRPPELDGERLFKTVLVTLLRGAVEKVGGTEQAWEEEVIRFVPYHPAGRWPEKKVVDPVGSLLGRNAIEGERALVEALGAVQGLEQRWVRMYDEDEMGVAARLNDPFDLGDDYDPAGCGPGLSWDALAEWGAGDGTFGQKLQRRLNAQWIIVQGAPGIHHSDLVPALLNEVSGEVVQEPDLDACVAAVLALMERVAPDVDHRVILVGEGNGIVAVLRALKESPPLRDRTRAVVSLGGPVDGYPGMDGPYGEQTQHDWMAAWYRHSTLDTELVRETAYFSIQWLDRSVRPPGVDGLPLARARFPHPPDEGAKGVPSVLVSVDLGPLPADVPLPLSVIARGVIATVGMWVLRRGG